MLEVVENKGAILRLKHTAERLKSWKTGSGAAWLGQTQQMIAQELLDVKCYLLSIRD
jgi:hypothetical protein